MVLFLHNQEKKLVGENEMKRIIVFLLLLALVIGPAGQAFADKNGDWEYFVDNGSATVTKYLGDDQYLLIPSMLGGCPVTVIGEGAIMHSPSSDTASSLITIAVPDTVKSIENLNFAFYQDLLIVELPEGLQSIGNNCFSNCGRLASIRIPSSVTGLGRYLFDKSDQVTVEVYPDSVAETFCKMEGVPYKVIGSAAKVNTPTPKPTRTKSPLLVDPKKYLMHTFDRFRFARNQVLDIYSGPGYDYYRAANGKAAASTNGKIYIFGWDGNWLMVLYGTGDGKSRMGYANKSDFSDHVSGGFMEFAHISATIATDCMISDCLIEDNSFITTLTSGTQVDYLAFSPDTGRAYIEVSTDVGLVRGFIPYDCLGF